MESCHTIINGSYDSLLDIKEKPDKSFVTNIDIELQKRITDIIKKTFPDDIVKSEEKNWDNKNSKRTWLIDPIDGTINYIEKNGEFSVCIAFLIDNKPVISAVIAPELNKVYHAIKGDGAYLNNKIIKCGNIDSIKNGTIVISRHLKAENSDLLDNFGKKIILGSTALRMCLVAEGKAECYIYNSKKKELNEWDIAAAHLIVEEAGGKVTNIEGHTLTYNNKAPKLKNGILATNKKIHEQVLAIV